MHGHPNDNFSIEPASQAIHKAKNRVLNFSNLMFVWPCITSTTT